MFIGSSDLLAMSSVGMTDKKKLGILGGVQVILPLPTSKSGEFVC